ncbi:MAG: hypothetical protein IPO92_22340 [Saprospiraceae bacterium]|nr:hypothetical protein [Saprospiraceae bacterium]
MKKCNFTYFKNQLPLVLAFWCVLIGFTANAQTYTRTTSASTTLATITTPTTIYLGDDLTSASIDLGFNFPYYGGNYNAITINDNGCLRFSPNNAITSAFTNNSISAGCGTTNTNTIFALWDDLLSAATMAISTTPGNLFGTGVTYGPVAGGGFAVTWVESLYLHRKHCW